MASKIAGPVLTLLAPAATPTRSGTWQWSQCHMNALRAACWVRRGSLVGLVILLAALPACRLAAQTELADAHWAAAEYHEARLAYQRVLVTDRANVRANFRLGILLSWDNKLDSALVMIRRARAEDHGDGDIEVAEGRVLAWAGRTDQAVAHYDSVIARAPAMRDAWIGKATALGWAGRYDEADAAYVSWLAQAPDDEEALVGRARLRAWKGDLNGARSLYTESLIHQPGSAAALAGLAQVDRWEGRERAALQRVDSALRVSPNDRDALQLRRELRASLRPQLQVTFGWGRDSDQNETFWEIASASESVADGVTLSGTVGLFQATDPFTSGDRTLGEMGLAWSHGKMSFGAGLGLRQLAPQVGGSRRSATARATISWRPTARVGVGLGYGRVPFDETAGLIARDLDVQSLEANIDLKAARQLDLSLGGGAGWLNDGNRRQSLLAAATWSFARYFFAGPYYRRLSYDQAGVGYFAPRPYQLAELRSGMNRQWGVWGARATGGIGSQRIGAGASQRAWHADLRLTRRLRVIDEVAIFGGITNAASASTTGAFKYQTAGLAIRLGL